jgi:hypothetical protein
MLFLRTQRAYHVSKEAKFDLRSILPLQPAPPVSGQLWVLSVKSLNEMPSRPIQAMHLPPPTLHQPVTDSLVGCIANDSIGILQFRDFIQRQGGCVQGAKRCLRARTNVIERQESGTAQRLAIVEHATILLQGPHANIPQSLQQIALIGPPSAHNSAQSPALGVDRPISPTRNAFRFTA